MLVYQSVSAGFLVIFVGLVEPPPIFTLIDQGFGMFSPTVGTFQPPNIDQTRCQSIHFSNSQ